MLVSRKARSVRFTADDEALRPMGRATAGVLGMRFVPGDELLSMSVVSGDLADDLDVFVVTDGGWGKRTPVAEHRVQGRGGLGILAAKVVDQRGSLVGALVVHENDEILAITSSGGVIRSRVDDVRRTGRATMGVRLINVPDGGAVVAIARNAEPANDDAVDEAADLAEEWGTGQPGRLPTRTRCRLVRIRSTTWLSRLDDPDDDDEPQQTAQTHRRRSSREPITATPLVVDHLAARPPGRGRDPSRRSRERPAAQLASEHRARARPLSRSARTRVPAAAQRRRPRHDSAIIGRRPAASPSARDWREAWRAARDNDGTPVVPARPDPRGPPRR